MDHRSKRRIKEAKSKARPGKSLLLNQLSLRVNSNICLQNVIQQQQQNSFIIPVEVLNRSGSE